MNAWVAAWWPQGAVVAWCSRECSDTPVTCLQSDTDRRFLCLVILRVSTLDSSTLQHCQPMLTHMDSQLPLPAQKGKGKRLNPFDDSHSTMLKYTRDDVDWTKVYGTLLFLLKMFPL